MPIWSLTKERVEKLLKQIGEREEEIDTLIKLSKEDLWTRDLDEFINEWRTQLEEEASLQKKVANMGRRASSKLKISAGGPARKRKAQGEDPYDSDFGTRGATKKAAVVKRVQPKQGLLSHLSPLAKPVAKPNPVAPKIDTQESRGLSTVSNDTNPPEKVTNDVWMNLDGASSSDALKAPISKKAKAAVVTKKVPLLENVKSEDEDEADEEVIRPAASRKPRTAAKKVPTYNLDDSDSNGDDFLLDVGKMVKGIHNASSSQTSVSRPLFSNPKSRPGSSAGLPKKSTSSRQTIGLDDDDTDYSKLVPPPATKRAVSVTARRQILSDDSIDEDEDDIFPASKPPPKAVKAPKAIVPKAAKAKAPTAAAKPSQASAPPKKMPLSPAAKAYAAKKAKNAAKMFDDDEVDKLADEILDEEEGNAITHISDDDDDDDDGLVVRRPARRAAAKAVENVKNGWGGGSEDDDDDDEEEESEIFDDEDDSD